MDQWHHWSAKFATPAAVISQLHALHVHVVAGICSSHYALTKRNVPSSIRLVQPLDADLSHIDRILITTLLKLCAVCLLNTTQKHNGKQRAHTDL